MTTANKVLYGYELKHVKALLQVKEAEILALEETIRIHQRNIRFLRRQQREKKTDANLPEKTLVYENKVCDLERLCARCKRYVKTL